MPFAIAALCIALAAALSDGRAPFPLSMRMEDGDPLAGLALIALLVACHHAQPLSPGAWTRPLLGLAMGCVAVVACTNPYHPVHIAAFLTLITALTLWMGSYLLTDVWIAAIAGLMVIAIGCSGETRPEYWEGPLLMGFLGMCLRAQLKAESGAVAPLSVIPPSAPAEREPSTATRAAP